MTTGYSIEADLKAIQAQKQTVELMNVYKGVPISIEASIVSVSSDVVVFKTGDHKSASLGLNRTAVIHHSQLHGQIKAAIVEWSPRDGIVRLGNFQYLSSKYVERKYIRVEPRNMIPVELEAGSQRIVGAMVDISMTGVGLYIYAVEPEHTLKHFETVTLVMRLPGGLVRVQGKLRGLGKSVDYYRLAINFLGNKPENEVVKRYIANRREEIVLELDRIYDEAITAKESGGQILSPQS